MDLYPTFAELAGAAVPEDQPLDGESIVPLLKASAAELKREDIHWWTPGYLPHRQAPAHAMRSGDWQVIEFFEDGHLEMFNLRNDIGERKDLAKTYPNKLRQLHDKLKAWRKATGAVIPPQNPDFDPANKGKW